MSTMQNNTNFLSNRSWEMILAQTQKLVLMALCGAMLALPMSAQSFDTATPKTGSILGTVVDTNDDPIPNATVVFKAPAGDPLTVVTKDDGAFVFHGAASGVAYEITVTAEGFAGWSSSVTVAPGEEKNLTDVKLRILAVQRAVTVSYSERQVAAQQLKVEEHQRVLGFIPNIYVTYEPHPEPLTTAMKFHLFYKGITHPAFFGFEGLWAGVEQYANTPNYPQGARGYGERFGANLASGTTEALFANAILPSVLHQDPRYFYRGSGSKGSRAWHAVIAPFVCQGDNGKFQPNYSQAGGSLISAGISYSYYPGSNRDAGLVFRNFGTSMGLHVVLGLAQEFLLGKVTSRGRQ
jgi:hypothetical protein